MNKCKGCPSRHPGCHSKCDYYLLCRHAMDLRNKKNPAGTSKGKADMGNVHQRSEPVQYDKNIKKEGEENENFNDSRGDSHCIHTCSAVLEMV